MVGAVDLSCADGPLAFDGGKTRGPICHVACNVTVMLKYI